MIENLPIVVLEESEQGDGLDSDMKITPLELDISGEPVYFRIGAADGQAKLADIVPAARLLSTKIVQAVQRNLSRGGIAVPCREGCAVCCDYLVFVSVPETFRLMAEATMMPLERCGDMAQSCSQAAQPVHEYLSEHIVGNESPRWDIVTAQQVKEFSDWYVTEKLPCPFLHGGLCTIYEQRPIICREHLVTGSASPCRIDGMDDKRKVRMPVRISNALKALSSELEGTIEESVVLPCVFEWYRNNTERGERTWPAAMMVERFVDIVKRIECRQQELNTIQAIVPQMVQSSF